MDCLLRLVFLEALEALALALAQALALDLALEALDTLLRSLSA